MKNPKLDQNQPTPVQKAGRGRIVGLDLHPEIFTAAILEGNHPMDARVSSTAHAIAMDSLLAWAQNHLTTDDLIVCEAGSNSFEAIKRLTEADFCAICLESQRVGQIRESTFNDDRSSAEKIARIYLSGMAKVVWVPDEQTRHYRELLGAHQEAVRQATRSKNSLRSFLTEHGVSLPKGTRLTKESTEALICESYDWQPIQLTILRQQCAAVREAEARRVELFTLMSEIISENGRMLGLMRLLGINVVNAFGLVATVGDINRFASPRKLTAFLGLVERRDQSGKSIDRRKKGVTGRKDMRTLLVQAAQAILNSKRKTALRSWGWQVFARRGKRAVAVIAVARKLAVQVFYQLKGNAPIRLEEEPALRRKLSVFVTRLKREWVLARNFATKKAFVDHLLEKLMKTPEIR